MHLSVKFEAYPLRP